MVLTGIPLNIEYMKRRSLVGAFGSSNSVVMLFMWYMLPTCSRVGERAPLPDPLSMLSPHLVNLSGLLSSLVSAAPSSLPALPHYRSVCAISA
jgi:hypothetical protein